MTIFDKWNQAVDMKSLQAEIKELEEGKTEYREVPVGFYKCQIDQMELKESSKGDPMFFVQLRILAGEFANSCLFQNQVVTQGFQIAQVNQFLRSLALREVEFVNYGQYHNLIAELMEAIDGRFAYLVEYKRSKRDFPLYNIKEVYELYPPSNSLPNQPSNPLSPQEGGEELNA